MPASTLTALQPELLEAFFRREQRMVLNQHAPAWVLSALLLTLGATGCTTPQLELHADRLASFHIWKRSVSVTRYRITLQNPGPATWVIFRTSQASTLKPSVALRSHGTICGIDPDRCLRFELSNTDAPNPRLHIPSVDGGFSAYWVPAGGKLRISRLDVVDGVPLAGWRATAIVLDGTRPLVATKTAGIVHARYVAFVGLRRI